MLQDRNLVGGTGEDSPGSKPQATRKSDQTKTRSANIIPEWLKEVLCGGDVQDGHNTSSV